MKFKQLAGIMVIAFMLPVVVSTAYATEGGGGATDNESYYDLRLKTSSLGNYEVTVKAYERPSHEILPIIGSEYFTTSEEKYKTEIDNTAPSAVYEASTVTKVDVVFALGELSQSSTLQTYIPTFTNKLTSASNNIDAYVEQVETSTVSTDEAGAEAIFATWDNKIMNANLVGFLGTGSSSDWTLSNNQVTSNVNQRPGRAWLCPDYTLAGDMEIKFRFGLNSGASDFGHGESGFLFRVASDATTSYAIIIDNHSACGAVNQNGAIVLCKIIGNKLVQIRGWGIRMFSAGDNYTFNIKLTNGSLNISAKDKHGGSVVNYTYDEVAQDLADYPTLSKGSYGFYVWDQKNAYFDQISVTTGSVKSLGDAISNVAWRDGSVRFIVHATDKIPVEFTAGNEDKYATTVIKVLNSNAYLVNLGTTVNQQSLLKLLEAIKQADGASKGIYYSNNPIISAMDKSADYIINIAKNLSKPTDWVLVNTEVLWNTEYKDNERDVPLNFGEHDGTKKQPQDKSDIALANSWGLSLANRYTEDKSLAERWRYKHIPTFYDNSNIQSSFHNIWVVDPIESFENPGKYRVNYKRRDNPLYPNVIITDVFDTYRYWSTNYERLDSK